MNEIEKALKQCEIASSNCKPMSLRARGMATAIKYLRSQLSREQNEPLRLEELRGMDGEPVFIIDGDEPDDRYWELSEDGHDYIDERNKDSYGKTWTAYRNKPNK